MRAFARLSILLVFTAFPALARAQIIVEPPPNNSVVPALIPVVGHGASGLPDPTGEIEVIVRDFSNQLVPGALVVLDFGDCTELRLCADAHDPGVTVDCATRTVRRSSDASGSARFRVMGWSVAAPGTPGAPVHSAMVFADGVLLGRPTVAIYDLDAQGLGAADLADWLRDFFSGLDPARGDYDGSGALSASDLSKWLTAYFAGGSVANCSPEGPCP